MEILRTDRLILRHLEEEDAPFILRLLNEPGWLRYIGDRGVRTLEDARGYIHSGPRASYAQHGFGLLLTELQSTGEPVGICGLLKRDELEHPDIGFALLGEHESMGYGFEAASGVMAWARDSLATPKVLAITSPGNTRSIRLLEKLGLRAAGEVQMSKGAAAVALFETPDT